MICLHHTDLDGQCAAAVLRYFYEVKVFLRKDIEFHPIDYHKPWPFDKLKDQVVYLLDFGFNNLDDLWRIEKIAERFIWIDHHKSNIEKLKASEIPHKTDWHLDTSKSGCELTWERLFKNQPPYAVELVGDYDTWKFKYGDESRALHEALALYNTEPRGKVWEKLFECDALQWIIRQGYDCMKYRDGKNKAYMDSWGFETEFEGHRCLAVNRGHGNSQLFGEEAISEFDILMPFVFDGKQWTISLYSDKIDVSKIAVKHGGGGHKGAAGFQCDELPFERKG